MKILLPLLLLGAAPLGDNAQTYLVSVVALPLKQGESLESFAFATWGVEFLAVCRIPGGWRIKAGSSATPDGTLEGEGSHGATWFNEPSPDDLRDLVLVKLSRPVQREDVRDNTGNALIPATFNGSAVISARDREQTRGLDYRNMELRAADRCPAR
jgi:hypothetical protein